MLQIIRRTVHRFLPFPFFSATAVDATVETVILTCRSESIVFSDKAQNDNSLPTISDPQTLTALTKASQILQAGSPVVFPTETVYGLAANALSTTAVSQIYTTKGRPSDNPLIVHISSLDMLGQLISPQYKIPKSYSALMEEFWPGPLTLLFPVNQNVVPKSITAGSSKVAIRMPSHPVARALIAMCGLPLAAPSANTSGKPSPTKAEHVYDDLRGRIELILDGGSCDVGLESTVVDGLEADGHIRVLRPGGVTVEALERVVGNEKVLSNGGGAIKVLVHRRDYKDEEQEKAPTTPGMKYRHYSPACPVYLLLRAPPESGRSGNSSSSSNGGIDGDSDSSKSKSQSLSDVAFTPETLLQTIVLRELDDQGSGKVKIGLLSMSDSPLTSALVSKTSIETDTRRVAVEWCPHPLGRLEGADLTEPARLLFDGLISLDKLGVSCILVEGVSEQREGLAVMNRVRKAAGQTLWVTV